MNSLEIAAFKHVFDSTLHLDFEIRTHYTDTKLEKSVMPYLQAIDRYNNFDADLVLDILERFDDMAPTSYLNENNPNNGKRVFDVWVGRESSPAVYIKWRDWGDPNYDEAEMSMAVDDFREIAEKIGLADEFSYDCERRQNPFDDKMIAEHEIRMWWD